MRRKTETTCYAEFVMAFYRVARIKAGSDYDLLLYIVAVSVKVRLESCMQLYMRQIRPLADIVHSNY